MFNSGVLNIVIGLVFIFLLYSLLATIIQEIIATWLGLRAKVLQQGISRMLDDDLVKMDLAEKIRKRIPKKYSDKIITKLQSASVDVTKKDPLKPKRNFVYDAIIKILKEPTDKDDPENEISAAFYGHPLIKYLGTKNSGKKPSYLTAQNFSKVVIDLLRGKEYKPGDDLHGRINDSIKETVIQWGAVKKIKTNTGDYLQSLWADAQGDVEKFRGFLEQWFDDTMERTTGWYKKKTQLILFFIGLTLAIMFNIDTISITKKLSHNPELAAQLANNASVYVENHKELLQQVQAESNAPIDNNGKSLSPIGAKQDSTRKISDSVARVKWDSIVKRSDQLVDSANALIQNQIKDVNQLLGLGWKGDCKHKNCNVCVYCNFHWWSIIGWLITALAVSLGASFWFDLLNKLMKLRSSVATSTPDDKQKEQESKSSQINRVG
jgi:hypothetical protein